jgi:hypothetical protein
LAVPGSFGPPVSQEVLVVDGREAWEGEAEEHEEH